MICLISQIRVLLTRPLCQSFRKATSGSTFVAFEQRIDYHIPVCVGIGVLLRKPVSDDAHFRTRPFERDLRFERPEDIENTSSAVLDLRGRESYRHPDISISESKASARRHHADHCEMLIVEHDRLVEDIRIAAEPPLRPTYQLSIGRIKNDKNRFSARAWRGLWELVLRVPLGLRVE
jgi:hypothetical protein